MKVTIGFLMVTFAMMSSVQAAPTEACKSLATKIVGQMVAASLANASQVYEAPFIQKSVMTTDASGEDVESATIWVLKKSSALKKGQLMESLVYSVDFQADKNCLIKSIEFFGSTDI